MGQGMEDCAFNQNSEKGRCEHGEDRCEDGEGHGREHGKKVRRQVWSRGRRAHPVFMW